jgi:hypothetical protein
MRAFFLGWVQQIKIYTLLIGFISVCYKDVFWVVEGVVFLDFDFGCW